MRKKLITLMSLLGIMAAMGSPVRSMLASDGIEGLGEDWYPTAADYVMDGLIRQLDSIETVGYGEEEHDSGTRLRNLATGHGTGCIIDTTVSWDGEWLTVTRGQHNLLFYNDKGQQISDAFLANSWTLEFYGRLSSVVGLLDNSENNYSWKLCSVQNDHDNTLRVGCGGKTWSMPFSFVEANHFSLVRDGDMCRFYLNGKEIINSSVPLSGVAPNLRDFYIYANTDFGSYRFYNVSLSADEVYYNYIIDRRRFGL